MRESCELEACDTLTWHYGSEIEAATDF